MTREEILKLPDEARLYIYELQAKIATNKDKDNVKLITERILLKVPARVFFNLKGHFGIDYDSVIADFSNIRLKDIRRVPCIGKVSVKAIVQACQEANVKFLT